jgi:hypothetical protein
MLGQRAYPAMAPAPSTSSREARSSAPEIESGTSFELLPRQGVFGTEA